MPTANAKRPTSTTRRTALTKGAGKSSRTTGRATTTPPTSDIDDAEHAAQALGGPRWEQIRTESLSEKIISQVRTSLFERQLRPGDFLGTETSLAEQFGVSRMASRDALRSLAAAGIVSIRQGAKGGAWISKGAIDRLGDALAIQLTLLGVSSVDVMELQTGLEAIACELAAERATDEDVKRLKDLLHVLDAAAGAPKQYASLAFDMHEEVMRIARNDALLAQFRGIRWIMEPVLISRATPSYVKESQEGHRTLVALIAARDAEGAWSHAHHRMQVWRSKQRS
jgi:GntR family transcriptional regulator, transcriptional repressor for pyruvate dehydrogenase complex